MKKYLILIIMLFSVFILTGCFKNEVDTDFVDLTDEIKDAGEINIKFRLQSGVLTDPNALPSLITAFNAIYPNVKIELDAVIGNYNDVRRITIMDIQNNMAPTMVIGYPDHFAEYYDGNALVNLQYLINGKNGLSQAELDDFIPSYLAEGRGFDTDNPNDLYALPLNKSTEVLIYNKTMFDYMKNNLDTTIEVPQTWDEVKTVSEKIITFVQQGKLDSVITLGTGEKAPSTLLADGVFFPFSYDSGANAFITMARQWKGDYTEKVTNREGLIKFDNTQVKDGLTYFQNEAVAKRFAVANTFSSNYSSEAFKALKVFMSIGSSAGVKYNLPEGNKFEVGFAKIPYNAANPDSKYVIQQGTNVAILAQSTNLQRSAAWLFIKFLMQPENTAKFAMATGGYLPVRQSSYQLEAYQEYLLTPPIDKLSHSKAANVALSYINSGYKFFVDPAFVGSSAVRDEVEAVFVAVIVNKKNIQERIDDAYNTLGGAYR